MALREEIIKPIKDSIGEFNLLYEGLSDSGIKLLDDMLTHVGQTRGKQLRPTLLLLIAGAFGNMSDKAVRAALAVETLHITTLIHDDVVDESLLRRGKQTLNSIWGNKLAVLAGDYLYAKALNILVDIEDNEILKTISRVAQEMGEGELLQQENAREYNLTEEKYYEVIRKKTAVLFSACCKIGAIVGRADESEKQKMYEFGQCLGIAFQIQDDILARTLSLRRSPQELSRFSISSRGIAQDVRSFLKTQGSSPKRSEHSVSTSPTAARRYSPLCFTTSIRRSRWQGE